MSKTFEIKFHKHGTFYRELAVHVKVVRIIASFYKKIGILNSDRIVLKGGCATNILFPSFPYNDFDVMVGEEDMKKVVEIATSSLPTYFLGLDTCIRFSPPVIDPSYKTAVVKGVITCGCEEYIVEFVDFPKKFYDFNLNSFVATFFVLPFDQIGIGFSARRNATIELYRYAKSMTCFCHLLSKKPKRNEGKSIPLDPHPTSIKRIEKALSKGVVIDGIEKMEKFEMCPICWGKSLISQHKFCGGKDCCVKCALGLALSEHLRFTVNPPRSSPSFNSVKHFFEIV